MITLTTFAKFGNWSSWQKKWRSSPVVGGIEKPALYSASPPVGRIQEREELPVTRAVRRLVVFKRGRSSPLSGESGGWSIFQKEESRSSGCFGISESYQLRYTKRTYVRELSLSPSQLYVSSLYYLLAVIVDDGASEKEKERFSQYC